MSRKIYNRLSFMAVSWLDESTLIILFACASPVQFMLLWYSIFDLT